MSSSERVLQAENLRDSYRCPVEGPQQAGQLCAGGDWIPVQVVDESAGGFGVLGTELSGVAVGDLVQLRTPSECFEAEVMYATTYPVVEENTPPRTRLGLKRVRELHLDTEPRVPWYQQFKAPRRRSPFGVGWSLGTLGFLFAILVGLVPILAVLFFEIHQVDEPRLDGEKLEKSWYLQLRESNPLRFSPASRSGRPRPAVRPVRGLDDRQRREWNNVLEMAKHEVEPGHWNDAVLAVLERLGNQMGLSPAQQAEVETLLKQTDAALRNSSTDQARAKLLEEAYRRLLRVLNDTQKVQLADLLDGSEKAANPDTP